jgi:hypothetical protein
MADQVNDEYKAVVVHQQKLDRLANFVNKSYARDKEIPDDIPNPVTEPTVIVRVVTSRGTSVQVKNQIPHPDEYYLLEPSDLPPLTPVVPLKTRLAIIDLSSKDSSQRDADTKTAVVKYENEILQHNNKIGELKRIFNKTVYAIQKKTYVTPDEKQTDIEYYVISVVSADFPRMTQYFHHVLGVAAREQKAAIGVNNLLISYVCRGLVLLAKRGTIFNDITCNREICIKFLRSIENFAEQFVALGEFDASISGIIADIVSVSNQQPLPDQERSPSKNAKKNAKKRQKKKEKRLTSM